MRIPIWPGVRLSVWEEQNPEAVQITMALYYKPLRVRRVLSMRGWALFGVRYDWRDRGRPAELREQQEGRAGKLCCGKDIGHHLGCRVNQGEAL